MRTSFFDDEDLSVVFQFKEPTRGILNELCTPMIISGTFLWKDGTADSYEEGHFALHNKFLVKYQDKTCTIPEKYLLISNSRCKVLLPEECDSKYGFTLTKNESNYTFVSTLEENVQDWYNVFKSICVLYNFHEEYKALKMIGKGSFAKVYLVQAKSTGKNYAVKSFTKESIILSNKNNAKPAIVNEIEIMRVLNHENTIKLYEVYETEKSIYLILDLIQGKSMQDVLKKFIYKEGTSEIKVFNMIRSILDALAYLGAKGIMHRDLKPENILLDQNDRVKIVDFGLATLIDLPEYIFKKCGTPGYIAPEVFKYDVKDESTHYDDRCDVFSAGCIFFYLLFGEAFLEGSGVTEILKNNRKISLMSQGYQTLRKALDNPTECKIPKDALNLLQKLLEVDPRKRITAAEALSHPYFTPIPCGMHRVPSSDGFVKLALSKYNQNNMSSPLFSSPLKNSSGSPLSNRSALSGGSPDKLDKLSNTPLNRYAEKDSLYLDMGRPEMNGKIDTLTSGSMNNSLLMLTRDNSHGNNSAAGSLSNFAKGKGGMEMKGFNKSFKNNLANNQSVLKAAIFRNMRNKSEVPALGDFQKEEVRDVRRGSIEGHLKIQVDTRRSTFNSESPSDGSKERDRQGDLSSSPEYEQNAEKDPQTISGKLPQINNAQKRYQPFTHR